ncbi:MAG: phosphoglycerate dehydrogenase [Candidatus Marinimicrobia bacterium]|nr:phosphoglycerate dehydrogenase [Candidatus Neomarinimicrobiota bacterium]
MLEKSGIEYLINPLNTKLTEDQLAGMVSDYDVIIAGTEPITEKVMKRTTNLKLISRVGIGLDSVDLLAAKKRGIKVSYTPDAPSPAVAELTLGLMLTLLRSVHVSNTQMHQGKWHRYFGKRLENVTVGIIGVGRIGSGVLKRLKGFGTTKIIVNDIEPNYELNSEFKLEWKSKEEIYKVADIISLHIPLTRLTNNMIKKEHLKTMKSDAIIINTSRGGIINEQDLYEVMQSGYLSGAAIDVYEKEPYTGCLKEIERCLLTAHMGSMSYDCRIQMEIEATEEAIGFLTSKVQQSEVPQSEYDLQRQRL